MLQVRKLIKSIIYLISFCISFTPYLIYSQGSNYTGPYKKSLPIEYTNEKDLVIEGLEFTNSDGRCLTLWNCENVIIKNCKFKDVLVKVAIYAEGGSNILVTNCVFENVHGGFIAAACKGGIKFEENDVKNILGNLHGGSVFSNAVHFNGCSGPNNSVLNNVVDNILGESSPEDHIAMYRSHGTPESPIIIKGNWLRGGGPSGSGGGINLGDWGGSYQIAENNVMVNTGQNGMGMAGGHDLTIRNNKIYGKSQPWTNVGLAIVNWTIKETGPSYNIVIENNDINWSNKEGSYNTAWFEKYMKGVVENWQEVGARNPAINEKILPEVILNTAVHIK